MDANRKELNETSAATCQSFISQDEANKMTDDALANMSSGNASKQWEKLPNPVKSNRIFPELEMRRKATMADSSNTAVPEELQKQLITIADDLNSASLVFEGLNLAL